MAGKPDKILNAALQLPYEQRVDIAEKLRLSLDCPERDRIMKAWAVEVERRIAELDAGKIKAIPLDKALKTIRNSLRRKRANAIGHHSGGKNGTSRSRGLLRGHSTSSRRRAAG